MSLVILLVNLEIMAGGPESLRRLGTWFTDDILVNVVHRVTFWPQLGLFNLRTFTRTWENIREQLFRLRKIWTQIWSVTLTDFVYGFQQ